MIQLLKFYRINSISLQWWRSRIFRHCLFYPGLFLLLYYWLQYFELDLKWLNSWAGKDIVNTLAIVSWFLLTGLSVILSNTKLDEKKKSETEEKFKSYIMEYGEGDIYKWLSKFKLSLLLDTIVLIGVCIVLALIITVFKSNNVIIYTILYFLGFLCINLLTLIKQILTYLHIVEFN